MSNFLNKRSKNYSFAELLSTLKKLIKFVFSDFWTICFIYLFSEKPNFSVNNMSKIESDRKIDLFFFLFGQRIALKALRKIEKFIVLFFRICYIETKDTKKKRKLFINQKAFHLHDSLHPFQLDIQFVFSLSIKST